MFADKSDTLSNIIRIFGLSFLSVEALRWFDIGPILVELIYNLKRIGWQYPVKYENG